MTLTDEQKTNYLRIALGLSKIGVDNRTAELIWRSYEGIIQKQGQYALDDQAMIEAMVTTKYDLTKKDKKKLKKKEKQEV